MTVFMKNIQNFHRSFTNEFKLIYFFIASLLLLCQPAHAKDQDTAGWEEYYEFTKSIEIPRPTLEKAVALFQEEGFSGGVALDLGAGTGRDTLHLLKNNWTVLAVDAQPSALRIITERVDSLSLPREKFIPLLSEFNTLVFPQNVQLINASYSLPYCDHADFPSVWQSIVNSLESGGRFAGQFFGERDIYFSKDPSMTFLSKEELENHFKEHFIIEYFSEEEGLKTLVNGKKEYCHIFHVVAKKL